MPSGQEKLVTALRQVLGQKEDKAEILPGALGMYNATGQKVIKVPNRTDFVYVRLRGQVSEAVEAFNEKVYLQFGLPVLLVRDPLAPRYYKIIGRDIGKYQGWGSSGLPPHGTQHSFSGTTLEGRDVTFIYRRQLAQPLLCRPQAAPDMTVYVEADYYFWAGTYYRFPGGSSASLTSLKPSSTGMGVFVTVYIDGNTNTVQLRRGDEFSILIPPSDVLTSIPLIDPSVGIPLAAVYLASTTATINWDDLYDIRVLIASFSETYPATHTLDPSGGYHSGSLMAVNVSITDAANRITGANAESAFQELANQIQVTGALAHDHRVFRWSAPSGAISTTLPDIASEIDNIFIDGFELTHNKFTHTSPGALITFSTPFPTGSIVEFEYEKLP